MSQMYYSGVHTQVPYEQTFVVYVKEDNIYRCDLQGNQVIGVTRKLYDEVKKDYDSVYARCQEYYNKLVELGAIVPVPTQEELAKRQAEQLTAATRLIEEATRTQERLLATLDDVTRRLAAVESAHEHSSDSASVGSGIVQRVARDDHSGTARGERVWADEERAVARYGGAECTT